MIGCISNLVPKDSIMSSPSGISVTDFYTYNGSGYVAVDTLIPGHGYWVKTNQTGKLIMNATSTSSIANRIKIVPDGESPPQPPISIEKQLPRDYTVDQNYPNPFNSSTVIHYQLPERTWVRLRVFNLLGQEVATLLEGIQEPGLKSIEFKDDNLQSGVYYYELIAGNFKETKKMILIK